MSFRNSYAEAVFIFDAKEIAREMHFSEFEAVLEGFVPLTEQAAQQVHAVYLRVEAGSVITAAVFFLIDFDKAGFADKRWNVPIEQLADTSAEGPDLGGGAIRLACRSQCAIAWHQHQLWDPQMTPQCNHFAAIKKAVKRNSLHLSFPEPVPTLTSELEASSPEANRSSSAGSSDELAVIEAKWRKRTAQTIKEARLKVATLQEQAQATLDNLNSEHRQQLATLEAQLQQRQALLHSEQQKSSELEALTQSQEQKLKGLREYFEHKLTNLKNGDEVAISTLRDHLETDFNARIDALQRSYDEKLQVREIEVMYRDTQLAGLREEVDKLHAEKQSLLASSGNSLLEQIHQSGISFVSFQPGAGHMTIPVDDVAAFMDDSDRYTAAKCRVSVELFRLWRHHYQNPVCTCQTEGAALCGRMLTRVDRPADFVAGTSDRCDQHLESIAPSARAAF
jgi:flagellar biosynthesis GTPase FlhF